MRKTPHRTTGRLAAAGLALALGLGAGAAPGTARADANPMLGDLMAVGFNFCPRGWVAADGRLLQISQFSALFSLYGTIYGGDGRTTFGLPDLRGREVVHTGNGPGLPNVRQGEKGGAVNFTLTATTMPSHTHTGTVHVHNVDGNQDAPDTHVLAGSPDVLYSDQAPDATLRADALSIANTGGGQTVNKRSPMLAVLWCVAIQGVFPSRN